MVARVRMTSNRSFTILVFALVSAIVFLITAKRLDQATWDTGNYNAAPPAFIHHPTGSLLHVVSNSGSNWDATRPIPTATVTVTARYTEAIAPAPTGHPPSPTGQRLADGGDGSQSPLSPAGGIQDPACEGFPDTTGILLVMKTGATESYDRLPVQIMTILKCLPDFLLFSDLEQHIGGFHVRDSLETVLDEAKEHNGDFDLYRLQKQCAVDQDNCAKMLETPDSAGWNLDKYKNIHMAEKSYRLRPDHDWYVFVDADTYVSWPNMVYALGQLDPNMERYLGSPNVIGDKLFAHGGSGYVVSRGAMEEFVGNNPGIANKYDVEIQDNCCGDFMFAQALNETIGILVEGFWPLSNGEKPFTIPYGHNTWCQAVGMMHHMNSEEISSFWEFERRRYRDDQSPLVFREVYEHFLAPKLQDSREDWDNGAAEWFYLDNNAAALSTEDGGHDPPWEPWRLDRAVPDEDKSEAEAQAHESWGACRDACLAHGECFQCSWRDGCCSMDRSFKMGKPVRRPDEERMRTMSGWNVDKIKEWMDANDDCEDRVDWPGPVKEAMELAAYY